MSVIFAFDEFELDAGKLQLRRNGKLMKVESSALRLLVALVSHAGELLSKDDLVDEVWEGRAVADNVITVAMARLRKALVTGRGSKEFVTTVYGHGYRFVRPVIVRQDSTSATPDISSLPSSETPFVGRERILVRLREALREARSGRGRLCVLLGEPGIGKTRVVEMLERELVDTPVRVAWGYCREAGETPPLWPWQELLNEISDGASAARLADTSSSAVDETAQFHFTGTPLEAPGADVTSLETRDTPKHRAFERLLGSFTVATKENPWVLVLDDLHRADAASLELLSHLVDRVARTRILVIATLRPAELGGSARRETPLPRILGHRNCERITLERLKDADVASYVAAFLDDPEGKLARAVHEKSEGNPFFMAELLRQLRDTNEPQPAALSVPDAALDLVRQRVANIDLSTRGLLSTCAVLGRSFELSVLAELIGRDPIGLMADLDEALNAEVLVSAPHSSTAFAFSHDLLRAVLYDALSSGERRKLHLRVGETLEQLRAQGSAVPESELAYHFHAALPLGDLRKTVRFCREAADAAVPLFAFTDVARYTRHALEALKLMERPSVRLRMSLLYLTAIYSRPHDAATYGACIDELVRLGREHNDGEMLVRAGALLNAHPGLKPIPGACALMEQAQRLLPQDCHGLRALALAGLASASPHCYDATVCEELAQDAVAHARTADSRGALYVSLLNQLYLIGGPAQSARAHEIASQLEQLAQRNPVELAALPVDLSFYRASHALATGAIGTAIAAIERARIRSRQLHHDELTWHCERVLALMQHDLGETAQTRETLSALHERALRLGLRGTAVFTAYDRLVLLSESVSDPAREHELRAALQYDPEDNPAFWALKIRTLASAGLHDEARLALREISPAKLSRIPCDTQYLGTLAHLTHAALLLGEASYFGTLEALLTPYAELFASQLFTANDGAVAQLLGMLAEASKQPPKAIDAPGQSIEQLERAVHLNQEAGLVARSAEASLLLARCLLSQGGSPGTDRAMSLARSVRASSGRLGMAQLNREAHAVLTAAEST